MTYNKLYTWQELPARQITPKITRRLVTGQNAMSVHFTLLAGAAIGEHHHPHEQISHILSGQLQFTIAGESFTAQAGEVVVIPPYAPHAAVALADSVVIDIFSPPREDFLADARPDYMKS